ncbi:hypothetical protein L2K70_10925 [Nocardioides KLBMP 9356]|uniref:ABC3 transporter permease C-terminal domain-containing protein n=1 Tax=Nocardioides potassii TaxID=2911371 RepID=A0ABS9HA82_9ACTN|nr:FtsX-like permease family protein [Nocardioides potassii]MCF6378115.1 hypothetical protein [Nocardioides potassii]
MLLLAFLTAAISPANGPYASDLLNLDAMRPAVIAALVAFVSVLLVLLAQCARIGGPDRDRRLAAFRLAGASPSDITRIVAADAFLSSSLGTVLGLITAQALKAPLGRLLSGRGTYTTETKIGSDSVRVDTVTGTVSLLPLDVPTPAVAIVVTAVAIPCAVAAIAHAAQWRVLSGPFEVARRSTGQAAWRAPLVTFVVGVGGLMTFSVARSILGITADQSSGQALSVGILALLAIVGMLLGTASIAQVIGQFVARRTGIPSLLIAGRRLAANPYTSSRVNAVLLSVATVAGFVLGTGEYLRVVMSVEDTGYVEILGTVRVALLIAFGVAALGVLVTCGESVVASRKSLSALIATGVPRRTLRAGLLLEAIIPLVLMLPVAVAAGIVSARGVLGTSDAKSYGSVANETIVVVPVPVPWQTGLLTVVAAWLVVLVVAWVATKFVDAAAHPSELRTMA